MMTPLANHRQIAPGPRPLVIAHRGASGIAPENTLEAFDLAVALGADGVEFDVQLSADGYPVVIHDARVDRTTNGSGNVSRLPLAELQRLDAGAWFERRLARRPRVRAVARAVREATGAASSAFSYQPVPTLQAVLSLLAAASLERIYVELKGNPSNKQALLDAVLSVIQNLSVNRSVTLLSFDHAIIRDAKKLDGGIRTAATFPVKGNRLISTRSIIRGAREAGVDEVALHFGLATRRAVDALHENGLSVSAWTVNGKLSMRRLVWSGVDALMTNFPDRLHDVLDSSPQRPLSNLSRRSRPRRRL